MAKVRTEGTSTKNRKTVNATQDQKRESSPSPQQRQQRKNQGELKREDQSQQKARNIAPERLRCSAAENCPESGKSSSAFVVEKPSFDGTLRFCSQCKEVIRIAVFAPFPLSSLLLGFVWFSPFCALVCSFFISSFPDCLSQSQQRLTFGKLNRNQGKHLLQCTAHPPAGILTSVSWTKMHEIQFVVTMNQIQSKPMKVIDRH
jgi:hypothetical protein